MTSDAKQAREAALKGFRRDLILNAAAETFAERGLDGATMRAIAGRAGCTTGAIYPLFASKEEIYAALLARSLDAVVATVDAAAAAAAPGFPRVEAILRAVSDYYATRPEELALGFYLYGGGLMRRGLSKPLNRALNARFAHALEAMTDALQDLGVSDPDRARREVVAMFSGAIGALILLHTGRLDTLRAAFQEVVETQIAQFRRAFAAGATP